MDVHAQFIINSVSQMERLVLSFGGVEDPAEVSAAFEDAVDRLVARVRPFNRFRLEAARLAYLPWARAGHVAVDPASTAARVEILAAVALAARNDNSADSLDDSPSQTLWQFVSEAWTISTSCSGWRIFEMS